jgi:hypothetical protein
MLLVFLVAWNALGEELRLKTRTIVPVAEQGMEAVVHPAIRSATNAPRRLSGRRQHWLIQFDSAEPPLAEWERRGASVVSSVPVQGYILSLPDGFDWSTLRFTYAAPIEGDDKISPLLMANLAPDAPRLLVVHFHRDVETWEMDAILDAEQITPIWNASLERHDRVVEIGATALNALKLWDEVEYLFPAPEGMKTGEAYLSCGGSVAGAVEIAMLAAAVGEGWDGPGRGSAALTYSFGPLGAAGTRAGETTVRSEALRAMTEWSRVAAVSFRESQNRAAARNLDLMFATGEHGDAFPFQPGTAVLGHSFFPASPNPEPIAGDIHINDAYTWSVGGGSQWDVYSVLLHELGHSLGIGHTDEPGSVMYPYYQRATELKPTDIQSIRQIYAAVGNEPPPANVLLQINSPLEGARTAANTANFSGTLENAGAGVRVEYNNETNLARGTCLVNAPRTVWTCAAVPLQSGGNRVAVTATSNGTSTTMRRVVQRETNDPVQVRITSPVSIATTQAAVLELVGTASHPSGIASVRWGTNRARSGAFALGTNADGGSWSGAVTLEIGNNDITVTALARSGQSATTTLSVNRIAVPNPAPTPPTEDRTPPRMTIQQPIGTFILTSATRLTFRGTATDNVGVRTITWTNSAGDQSGTAAVTGAGPNVSWTFDVGISVGFNTIQIRAWDTTGNSTLYQTTVRRY